MSDPFGDRRDPLVKAMDRADREKLRAEIERLRAVVTRAKDALLDGQSTQWVHDLLVAALTTAEREWCYRTASERDVEIERLRASENKRLRAALEAIKTLEPLQPVGGWGDPYLEMTISAIGIATNALAGRALLPRSRWREVLDQCWREGDDQ